jgi:hypothetical protein
MGRFKTVDKDVWGLDISVRKAEAVEKRDGV